MHLTAHRGFGDAYPENTVCAFRRAVRDLDESRAPDPGVEVDVRRSGSGDLVASHFSSLRWVSDATGQVEHRSTEELECVRVAGSDCGVPRLVDALDAVPAHVRVDIDLKEPGLADDALELAAAVGNEVVVSSFYSDALWEARTADADVALAYNFDVRLDRHFTTTELLGCDRANLHWAVCLATDALERARQQGMAVYAWPVGSRAVAWALGRRGVDGVVATRPEVYAWARRGARA